MSNITRLWLAWDAGGRRARDRDAIVVDGQTLVRIIARSVKGSMPREVSSVIDLEDMCSVGVIGLMKAVEGFDPERGVVFETYAQHKIRGAILDHLRTADLMPSATRRLVNQLRQAEEILTQRKGGVMPTDAELAGYMQVTETKVARLRRIEATTTVYASERGADGPGDDSTRRGSGLLNGSETTEDSRDPFPFMQAIDRHDASDGAIDYDLLKERLADALELLDGAERTIMALYYIEELGMPEIARLIGISPAMVSKVRDQAMRKVLATLRA